MDFYYNLKSFLKNLPWMLKAAWEFRPWDSSYNIELFCKSLEVTAESIKNNANHVGADKTYRRCLIAAKQLRSAYTDSNFDDKSLEYLMKSNPTIFIKIGKGMTQVEREYKISKDYYSKMFKLLARELRR